MTVCSSGAMRTITIILILVFSILGPSFEQVSNGLGAEGKTETADEKVLEGAPSKKPVVRTWFEPGSVILKIQVENPSKEKTQTFPVKVPLPKEVNPKDILDLGDLKLNFDPETGLYSVSGEVTLEPGQSVTKLVEMEDIWMFTEEKLSSFVNQANRMASKLAGTP